ncbi:MAG: hypothetical protein IJM77_07650 [Spirochaetia bacterium]|nr:hypothetical protein [Spirochaetia bacterium]MBQ3712475.1 hypothetical protein [Spirochaetia bacterium]MBQ6674473.1 hypothetical protein [Spirochaetia bacterium]
MFENIIGHRQTVELLKEQVSHNRLPGSILIEGPRYAGKLTLALELARALTCTGDRSWNCRCPSCRSQKLLVHPDTLILGYDNFMEEISVAHQLLSNNDQIYTRYLFIRSVRKLLRRFDPVFYDEKETKFKKVQPLLSFLEEALGSINPDDLSASLKPKLLDSIADNAADLAKELNLSTIPVNQIRKVTFWAHTSTTENRKVVIIENAEKMNDSARNSMLKILEEPPANCFFIFLSSRTGEIIPTIRSRLRSYPLKERTAEEDGKVLSLIFRENSGLFSSISSYFDSFDPDVEKLSELAGQFLSYYLADSKSDELKNQLILALRDIKGESVKVFLEKLLEHARAALTGAVFGTTHKLEMLSRRLDQIWFDFESLNMNPQLLFEYLLYDTGGNI